MADGRKRLFEIIRVKNLYQAAINKKLGHDFLQVSLDESTTKGSRNYSLFGKIIDMTSERGINVDDYITVLVMSWDSKKAASRKPYPYLNFLASDIGFQIYGWSMQQLKRKCVSDRGVKVFIKASNPIRHEDKFVNCFYNGFSILEESDSTKELEESPLLLFVTFLAYSELFTPEFMVTHSRYPELENLSNLTEDELIMRPAIFRYTKATNEKIRWRPGFLNELIATRKIVNRREKRSYAGLYGLKGEKARIWRLLM